MQEIFALARRRKAAVVALCSLPKAVTFWQHLGWKIVQVVPGQPERLSRHLKRPNITDPLALANELEQLSEEQDHELPLMLQFIVAV